MARGELEKSETKGSGATIWAVFAVLCLVAAFFVIWTTGVIETWSPPWMGPVGEPFAGAQAALGRLGHAACDEAQGPALPGPPVGRADAAALDRTLDLRGYQPAGPWSEPVTLPTSFVPEALEGSCGVVAVAIEVGHLAAASAGGRARVESCRGTRVVLPVCEGDLVALDGNGAARTRVHLIPGLTPDVVRAVGAPLEVVVGHAEAEHQLREIGWRPTDELVEQALPASAPGAAGSYVAVQPPAAPSGGCVPFVAVGTGLGGANSSWLGNMPDPDPYPSGFVLGLVACTQSGGTPMNGEIGAMDADGGGGRVFLRAYSPPQGPTLPEGVAGALSIATARVVDTPHATLPAAVPMIEGGT